MTTITTSSSTSTAAVPLTTVFTPPASCDKLHWVSSKCLESTCKGIYNIVRATDEACFPSGWETTKTGFSPGLSCPANYYVNTSNVVVLGVDATETHATCCPSGFTVAKSSPQVWYTREPCMSISRGTTTIEYTVVGASPTTTTQMVYKNPIVHAFPVGLTYRSTDNASPTTSPPTTSPTPSPTETPASTQSSSGGLSTGAKAGIGVGVGVGGLIILALGFFFLFRWKKHQKSAAQAQGPGSVPTAGPFTSPPSAPGSTFAPAPAPFHAAAAAPPAWSEPGSGGSGSMTKETTQQELVKLPPQRSFQASELPGSNPHVAELDSSGEPPLAAHSPHSPHSPQYSQFSPQSQNSQNLPFSPLSPNRF